MPTTLDIPGTRSIMEIVSSTRRYLSSLESRSVGKRKVDMRVTNLRREGGFMLITMAIAAIATVGALGMAVDVGRAFIAKNETQSFCDAAAYAAVLKLSVTSCGITTATAGFTNAVNPWNMNTASVSNPSVDFATSANGPWSKNPSPATGYIYARVQASVDMPMYFIPVVINWVLPDSQTGRYTQTVNTAAIAGQIPQTTFDRGLAPYTVVSTNPGAADFALVVGNRYDIQWPAYNGTRAGCTPSTPAGCFVPPPCSGESFASKAAVASYWGANLSGYWGSNSNSLINAEVLDNVQTSPITLGQNIFTILTSGNKKAEAKALDTRVQEDGDYSDNDLTSYYANQNSNYRRFTAFPLVTPRTTHTPPVLGFASFFLVSDGSAASTYYEAGSGNDPYCAVYAGSYLPGGSGPPASGGARAFTMAVVPG